MNTISWVNRIRAGDLLVIGLNPDGGHCPPYELLEIRRVPFMGTVRSMLLLIQTLTIGLFGSCWSSSCWRSCDWGSGRRRGSCWRTHCS